MNRSLEISIPKPCHEDWRKFTPTLTGGFCQACQKEVIDFTQWTDQAIAEHFEKAKEKSCGRFLETQLKRFQHHDTSSAKWPLAAFLTLAALGLSKPSEAKSPKLKTPIEQRETYSRNQIKADTLIDKIIITGTVRDEDGAAMPGVNIVQKRTSNVVVSDENGKFMLVINRPAYVEKLIFSFIAMETLEQEVVATQSEKSIEVVLKYDLAAMTETIVVGGAISVKRFSPRGIWWKIRGLLTRSY
jgi:hypothetical protein